jgi:hypothetical protein
MLATLLLLAASAQSEAKPLFHHIAQQMEPATEHAKRAKSHFIAAAEARQWEKAHEAAGAMITAMDMEPMTRVMYEWYRHDLLLIAHQPQKALSMSREHLKPFGIIRGKEIKRPKDTLDVPASDSTEDESQWREYSVWLWSYSKALELTEYASVMVGDFNRAIWALEEQQDIPSVCGTGMERIIFARNVRKEVWRTAVEEHEKLRLYARRGFKPWKDPSHSADDQITAVALYSKFALAGTAPAAHKASAYQRLYDHVTGETLVNDKHLLYWIAKEGAEAGAAGGR